MNKRSYLFLCLIINLFIYLSCSNDAHNVDNFSEFFNNNYNPTVEELKSTNIPVVSILVDNNEEVTEKVYKWKCKINISDGSPEIKDVKIKCRGNTSFNVPKKSYTLKFDSKNKILGMIKNKNWVLIANYFDKTLLRNYITYDLAKNVYNFSWTPNFKNVHLIINNEYRGVYLLGESIKINSNRVDIQDIADYNTKDFIDINNDNSINLYDGGFILEINRRLDEEFNFITKNGVCFSLKEPDTIPENVQNHIKNLIQEAENSLFSSNFKDPINGYSKYFDIDSFVNWYLINEFSKNIDSAFFSSVYMYYNPADAKIHMGPVWDYDLAYGNQNESVNINNPKGFYIGLVSNWYERLLSDKNFVDKVKNTWVSTRIDLLDKINNIDVVYNNLEDAFVCNYTKCLQLNLNSIDKTNIENELVNEIDKLKNWMLERYNFMDSYFLNLP